MFRSHRSDNEPSSSDATQKPSVGKPFRRRRSTAMRHIFSIVCVALMMQRENGTASNFWSSCQELPSGTEVFVELVPYFNLCIRASDEVSCMWSDEGWKMRLVK